MIRFAHTENNAVIQMQHLYSILLNIFILNLLINYCSLNFFLNVENYFLTCK